MTNSKKNNKLSYPKEKFTTLLFLTTIVSTGLGALYMLLNMEGIIGPNIKSNNNQKISFNTRKNIVKINNNNENKITTNKTKDLKNLNQKNDYLSKLELNENKISILIDNSCSNSNYCSSGVINGLKDNLLKILGKEFNGKIEIFNINKEIDQKEEMKNFKGIKLPLLVIGKGLLNNVKIQTIINQGLNNINQIKLKNGIGYEIGYWKIGYENDCNDGKDNNLDGKIDGNDPSCINGLFLTSNKCDKNYCKLDNFIKGFLGIHLNKLDYNTTLGKEIYNKLSKVTKGKLKFGIDKIYLPVILLEDFNDFILNGHTKEQALTDKGSPFIDLGTGSINLSGINYKYYMLNPNFKYDPSLEKCYDNCSFSKECKKLLVCNKTDKPKVELFVMSYCPFGTQAEKGIIPVINLLKDKIDFKIKFVNYIMHDKKEIEENTLQSCIQKEEPKKYIKYLTCFLGSGDSNNCIKKANININVINKCKKELNKKYKIEDNYNNVVEWINGQFPKYLVNDKENKKYGVEGSPTLIINGIKVQPENRSPETYLKLICSAFKNPPKECNKKLSDKAYDSMWGWTKQGKAAPVGTCNAK